MAILKTIIAELGEIIFIVGTSVPEKMRTFTSTDTVENENVKVLRHPKEMLDTPSLRSYLPAHMLTLS